MWHGVFLRSVRRLLVTASVVPSSPILVTLMMEVLSSFKSSVLAYHKIVIIINVSVFQYIYADFCSDFRLRMDISSWSHFLQCTNMHMIF
jgi:hypothetical protein